MDKIVIPMDILKENDLNINEYLILFNLANKYCISNNFDYDMEQLVRLEKKGFIKISPDKIFLREKTENIFSISKDLFLTWLSIYPVKVKKTRSQGSRALSPAGDDTILGRNLRAKWDRIFKKNIEAQENAIKVLELQLKDMKKSGDLEYMVEATRWLNEGYHEKYSYLLDENHPDIQKYENEDYL